METNAHFRYIAQPALWDYFRCHGQDKEATDNQRYSGRWLDSIRSQMGTGIWMCRSRDANILVMDVEGTDDRERGEQVGGDQCYKSKNKDSATTI